MFIFLNAGCTCTFIPFKLLIQMVVEQPPISVEVCPAAWYLPKLFIKFNALKRLIFSS